MNNKLFSIIFALSFAIGGAAFADCGDADHESSTIMVTLQQGQTHLVERLSKLEKTPSLSIIKQPDYKVSVEEINCSDGSHGFHTYIAPGSCLMVPSEKAYSDELVKTYISCE